MDRVLLLPRESTLLQGWLRFATKPWLLGFCILARFRFSAGFSSAMALAGCHWHRRGIPPFILRKGWLPQRVVVGGCSNTAKSTDALPTGWAQPQRHRRSILHATSIHSSLSYESDRLLVMLVHSYFPAEIHRAI